MAQTLTLLDIAVAQLARSVDLSRRGSVAGAPAAAADGAGGLLIAPPGKTVLEWGDKLCVISETARSADLAVISP